MFLSILSLWLSALFVAASPGSAFFTSSVAASDIPWNGNKRLAWSDFAGSPSSDNPHHALTTTNMELKVKCEDNKLKFKVEAVFNPKESWTRNKTSAQLLAHEQLHFDLTEVHARLLRKRLGELPGLCQGNAADFDKFANEAFSNWHQEQDLYDQESRHGLNKEIQMEWIASVEVRLKELEAYQ